MNHVCSHTGSAVVLGDPEIPFCSLFMILSRGCQFVSQLRGPATPSAGTTRQRWSGGCLVSIASRAPQVLEKPGSGEW